MTRSKPPDGPLQTMTELTAAAAVMRAEAAGGIECPKCGCHDWRVYKTGPKGSVVRRRRECRHCGHRLATIEKVER